MASPHVVASSQAASDEIPVRPRGGLALAEVASRPLGAPAAAHSVDPVHAVVVPMRPVAPQPGPLKAAEQTDHWRAIVERLRAANPPSAALFEHGVPVEVGPARIVIGFAASAPFLSARAAAPEALDALRGAALAHFGVPPAIGIDTSHASTGGGRSIAAVEAERRRNEDAQARAAVETHPVVREAMRLFDAQLRDVKLPRDEG